MTLKGSKQYKSSITKNHKIKKKKNVFDGVPLKVYVAFQVTSRFFTRNEKKAL